jgi:hypothetical protein
MSGESYVSQPNISYNPSDAKNVKKTAQQELVAFIPSDALTFVEISVDIKVFPYSLTIHSFDKVLTFLTCCS